MRAAVVALVACVLPWYSENGPQWSAPQWLALVVGAFGFWVVLNWWSPVVAGLAFGVAAFLSLIGWVFGGAYDAVTPFPIVALVGFVVAVVGAVRTAPGR